MQYSVSLRHVRARRPAIIAAAMIATLATVFVALFAADTSRGSPSSTTASQAECKANVAFVFWNTVTNAFQEMNLGVQQAVREHPGVCLISSAPSGSNPAAVVQMFQSATRTSKDGIVLQALAADLFLRPVQEATKDGIPVVSIDAPPPANAGVDLFVTNDNVKVGRDIATHVLKAIPKSTRGEIVIGSNGIGVPPLDQRVQGMIAVIKKQRPKIKIVGPLSSSGQTGSPSDNYTAWNGIIKAHPKALAFLAPSNNDGVSFTVWQERNKKKILAAGADLEQVALKGVKDGYLRNLGSPEHWLKGYIAMSIVIDKALNGKAIPKGVWDSGSLLVTKDNIDAIIKRQRSPARRALWFKPVAKEQLANPGKYIK
jgi:ribose transport system substrate-binding protein